MRILTTLLAILLIAAFISMAWPFLLGLLIIMLVLGVVGTFRLRRQMNDARESWQSSSQSSWIGDEEEDTFEKRVDQPEVFEAEYTERGTEEDGSQSNTTRF